MHDPQYELWVKENHPGSLDADSMKTHISNSVSTVSSGDLSEILKYPEAKVTSKAKKLAMNSTNAVCLSDSPVVRQLKEKEEQKTHSVEEKGRKKKKVKRRKKNMSGISYLKGKKKRTRRRNARSKEHRKRKKKPKRECNQDESRNQLQMLVIKLC